MKLILLFADGADYPVSHMVGDYLVFAAVFLSPVLLALLYMVYQSIKSRISVKVKLETGPIVVDDAKQKNRDIKIDKLLDKN